MLTATITLHSVDWAGLVILLGAGLVLLWLAGAVAVWWQLRHPPRCTYAWAMAHDMPGNPVEMTRCKVGCGPRAYSEWTLSAGGGKHKLPVWDITGDNSGGPVVVISHGWADSRVTGLARLEPFLPMASRVILWDMPGHGEAPGMSQMGRGEAKQLIELLSHTEGPVILVGRSMGAGVSLEAASSSPRVIGVVVEAPYRLPQTPAGRVLAARGFPRVGMLTAALTASGGISWQSAGGIFDRMVWAGHLKMPLLVLHGSEDPVCPLEDGRAIAQAATLGQFVEIPGGKHNDLWTKGPMGEATLRAVTGWLKGLTAPART